jgi:hypothetical protein
MKTIFKYPIPQEGVFELKLPEKAKILTVQIQKGNPQMWAIVDPQAPLEKRIFRLAGTGHPLESWPESEFLYIGTFQLFEGDFIGHLFEVK